jgi:hypothetical protein
MLNQLGARISGLARLTLAAAASMAFGAAALAQPDITVAPQVLDLTPSAGAPADLEAGDRIELTVTVGASSGGFFDPAAVWSQMTLEFDLDAALPGLRVEAQSANCSGAGPSAGATTAVWSNMATPTPSFSPLQAVCEIAVEATVPAGAAPGTYTIPASTLEGVEQALLHDGSQYQNDGAPTVFSLAIPSFDFTVAADTTSPTGAFTAPSGIVPVGQAFSASINFSEDVTGFDATDLSVTNGSVSNFQAVSNESGETRRFTFDVTPDSEGTVTIDAAAAAAQDLAGNDSADIPSVNVSAGGRAILTVQQIGDLPEPGGSGTLEFSIENTSATEAVSGAAFSVNMTNVVSGLSLGTPLPTTPCGAGSSVSGATTMNFTGGAVAAGATCTFTVPVTLTAGVTPASYNLATSALSYSLGGSPVTGDTARTTFTVAGAEGGGAPLSFTKQFIGDPLNPGGTVTLEYTIIPPEGAGLNSLSFTDDLDAALTGLVSTSGPQNNVCGTGSSLSGTSTLTLTDGVLAAGETCTFSVTLAVPSGGSGGSFVSTTSDLSGNENDGGGDVALAAGFTAQDTLVVNNPVPQVTVSGPAGPVGVGLGFTVDIAFSEDVENFVVGDLSLTNAAASGFSGSGSEFSVTVTPAAPGAVSVSVGAGVADAVSDGDVNAASNTYSVTAETPAPEIFVQIDGAAQPLTDGALITQPTTGTEFGQVDVTTGSLARTITISNTGTGPLTVSSIGLTDTTNYSLSVAALPTAIAAGGSLDATLTYDPTAVAAHDATVTINSDDADEAAFDFVVSGEGVAGPEIEVRGNTVVIADGDTTQSATDHTIFAEILAGATSSRTYTINNLGGGALTLGADAVSITNDASGVFSVSSQPGTSIAASGSDTFVIEFAPASPGTYTGVVSVASDDPDENPYTFAIQATATGAPEVALEGNSVVIVAGDVTPSAGDDTAFGELAVGQTASATFTIRNTGSLPLTLSPAPVDRDGGGAGSTTVDVVDGSGDFTITSQPATTVAAGDSTTFTVQYAASTDTDVSATIAFGTNDADEGRYAFDVSGSGNIAPSFSKAFSPDTALLGAVSTLTFTIDNTASARTASSLDFTDNFPVGMEVADIPNASTTCTGGTLTAAASSGTASYTGGSVAAGASCTVQVDVVTTTTGALVNTTGDLTASTGNGGTATDTLTVGLPALSINDVTVAEGAGTATFTVSLDAAPSAAISVDYATSDVTAEAGSDYTAVSDTLTFAAGETSKTVDVTITSDAAAEATETFTVTLSNPSNATISDASGTGTITDDDAATVTIADVAANEDDGAITVTATLDVAVQGGFTVDVSTADGTATTADSDYTAVTAETLTFTGTAGETQTFTVTPTSDATLEPNETLTVSMSNLAGASGSVDITDGATVTLTNDDAASVTIADASGNEDDGAITVTATLDNPVAGGFTVDVSTADGTATTADSDYTAIAGQTLTFTGTAGETQTFTVTPTSDTKPEDDETLTVSLGNLAGTALPVDVTDTASVSIDNDDAAFASIDDPTVSEGAGTATFTVTLDRASTQTITIDYATSDVTAEAGSDYTAVSDTLTFAAGETSKTIDVTITSDAAAEATETFTVTLSNPSNATISDASGTGTITDDDAATVTIADVAANEDDGAITVTATLDVAVQGGFTVDVSTADGTATTADSDYTAVTAETLTFTGTAGETQTFTVTPTSDATLEPNETLTVSMSNLAGASGSVDITDGATVTLTNDDAASVTIADASGNEDDGAITVTATLDNPVAGGFTVDVSTADGTATTADSDYTAVTAQTLSFTGFSGETQTFTVTPTADAKPEDNETVSVSMSNLAGTALPVDVTDTASVGVTNDDSASLSVADVTAGEGDGTATVTVTLSVASALTTTVDYATSDGTALAGADYTAASGTLTFNAGVTTQTFDVTLSDDALNESNEDFTVTLSNASNATLSDSEATVTITDNDALPSISIADVTAGEGEGVATFTVTLDAPSGQTVTVDYATADLTATAGADYTAASGTLTFNPGTTSLSFDVPLTDDTLSEASEAFLAFLSSPANATLGTDTATGTITDNDALPNVSIADVTVGEGDGVATFTVTLDAPSGQTVRVDYATADGSAEGGADYTEASGSVEFDPGVTSRTFDVALIDDALDEESETFTIVLTSPFNAAISDDEATGTITDNDDAPSLAVAFTVDSVDEGAGTVTVNAELSAPSALTASADYRVVGATFTGVSQQAAPGEDFVAASGSVTFQPGETLKTVTVTLIDDALDEVDEGLVAFFETPTNVNLGPSATQFDVVTITDNDDAPLVSLANIEANEGDGTATFTVTLDAPSGRTITMDYSTADASGGTDPATAGEDYEVTSGTLTFDPGVTERQVSITLIDDALSENSERFGFGVTNVVNAATEFVGGETALAVIIDNDALPVVSISDATVSEDAGTMTFSVSLSAPAGRDVGVNYASSDGTAEAGTDYSAVVGGLQFDPGVTVQTIDVAILDDGVVEPDETFSIELNGSPLNAVLGTSVGTGTITNDDAAPAGYSVAFDADPINAALSSAASFTFTAAQVGADYAYTITSSGGGASVSGSGTISAAGEQISGIDVSSLGDGTLTLTARLTDTFGNDGPEVTAEAEKDASLPRAGLGVATSTTDPVSGAFGLIIQFSEIVTGLTIDELVISNGTAVSLRDMGPIAPNLTIYEAVIEPAADGTITADLPANVAQDAAGNGNTAAPQFSITADLTAPTVASVTVSDADLRLEDVGDEFTLTVAFSEPVDPEVAGTVSFDADLSATLSTTDGALNDDNTAWVLTATVLDGGQSLDGVEVSVSGFADAAGNAVVEYEEADVFAVEMARAGLLVSVEINGSVDGVFAFTGDLAPFEISTASQTGEALFEDLAEGEYAFALTDPDGFSLDAISCSGATAVTDADAGTVQISLTPDADAECLFDVTADPAVDPDLVVEVPLVLPANFTDPTSVSATFPLTNTGGAPLDYRIEVDVDWLSVSPNEGSIPAGGTVEFTVAFTEAVLDLEPGSYTATISFFNLSAATPAASTGGGAGTQSLRTQSVEPIQIPVTVQIVNRNGTLTLIATAAQSDLAGQASFGYQSDIASVTGRAIDTVGGTGSIGPLDVERGSYTISQTTPEGWRLDSISCTGDADSGSVADVASGTLSLDLDPDEAVVCTFANVPDEAYVVGVTTAAIRDFMAQRADQILSNSPRLSDRLRRGRDAARSGFAADFTEGRFSTEFATSLSALRAAGRAGDPFAEESEPAYAGFDFSNAAAPGVLDVWVEASWAGANDNRAGQNSTHRFGMVNLGADLMISENLLAGVLLQFDRMETSTGVLASQVEGDGWLAGPYVVYRLSPNLYVDARAAWGRSDNSVNPLGTYWDDFETDRRLVEANIVGDIQRGAWRFSPAAGLAWFDEDSEAYVDSLGFNIPGQSLTLGRARFEPELAYRVDHGQGAFLEPYVKLTANYDFEEAEVFNAAGGLEGLGTFRVDGRIGFSAGFSNGAILGAEVSLNGIGEDDFEASSAMIRLRTPLALPGN